MQIEGAKDPDEFVVKYGPDKFQKYVDSAISLVEFKVKMLKNNLDLKNVNDKIKFLNEIAKILAKVDNKIEQEVYIDKIAQEYDVSSEAIYAQINKILYSNNKSERRIEKNIPQIKSTIDTDKKNIDDKIVKREKLVVYLLINYPQRVYDLFKGLITDNLIYIDINKKIILKLYEEFEKGNINIENIINWFEDEDIVSYLSEIMASDFEITDLDKSIEDVISSYKKEKLLNERNIILKDLENKENSKESMASLENKLNEIIIKLAKMK